MQTEENSRFTGTDQSYYSLQSGLVDWQKLNFPRRKLREKSAGFNEVAEKEPRSRRNESYPGKSEELIGPHHQNYPGTTNRRSKKLTKTKTPHDYCRKHKYWEIQSGSNSEQDRPIRKKIQKKKTYTTYAFPEG